jgi:hypothetical protein
VAVIGQDLGQGGEIGVGVETNGQGHGELRDEEAAGRTAVASPADPSPNRPEGPLARVDGQWEGKRRRLPGEGPAPQACARCGREIDRETRHHSGYCSDECKEEARESMVRERKASDAWAFALGPLYSALGPVDDVRLIAMDRARVEERHAAALPVVSGGARRARRAGAPRLPGGLVSVDAGS